MLGQQTPKIARVKAGVDAGKPVEVYRLTFEAAASRDLVWAGVFPNPGAITYGGRRVNSALNRPLHPTQSLAFDIALYVDPGRGIIQRAHVRGYSFLGMPRGVKTVGGGRPWREEKEEEPKNAKPKPPQFKDGLPVRKAQNQYVMEFDITFDEQAGKLPDLDARAGSLLGLK